MATVSEHYSKLRSPIYRFSQHANTEFELVVRMTDTILHIDSKEYGGG